MKTSSKAFVSILTLTLILGGAYFFTSGDQLQGRFSNLKDKQYTKVSPSAEETKQTITHEQDPYFEVTSYVTSEVKIDKSSDESIVIGHFSINFTENFTEEVKFIDVSADLQGTPLDVFFDNHEIVVDADGSRGYTIEVWGDPKSDVMNAHVDDLDEPHSVYLTKIDINGYEWYHQDQVGENKYYDVYKENVMSYGIPSGMTVINK